MTKMKIRTALRNLDKHGQQRAPEVIAEEGRQLENHLKRFRSELVRLEVVASQTKGKTRIQVRLRLQLPSSVIAAQEEGFEIEPTLRKAFADLRHRVDRHVARLKHESEFKRPARRRRIGAPLPPARDAAEAGLAVPIAEDDCVDSEIARAMRLPLPIDERRRVAAALSEGSTGTTA